MKNKHSNNGFTIIEILVGINIGFVLLTIIVAFFLFSTKFISVTSKNFEERQNINDFLLRLNNTFRKADYFYFQQLDSTFICIIDKQDTVVFRDNSINLKNTYEIDELTNYKMIIQMNSGIERKIHNGTSVELIFDRDQNSVLLSSDISQVKIDILINKKFYSFYYFASTISIKNFRNISN